jgi:hypothetical protein
MRRKKKKALPPRVKRMKRPGRLQSARSWLPTYSGKNIVAGYRKHFGVDWICALKELEMLGVAIDPIYKQQLLITVENHNTAHRRKKAQRAQRSMQYDLDQGDQFAYIAGYTAGGFAYGVTWEEWKELERGQLSHAESPQIDKTMKEYPSDTDELDEIPF